MEELFAELTALQVSLVDGHPWNCIFQHGRPYPISYLKGLSLVERYNRIFTKSYAKKGPWVDYRPAGSFESEYDSDPRIATLKTIIAENKIMSAIDVGANDGLHSYFMAKECRIEVLSLEYEDFNSS